ncbi:MAG: hypothetical protein WD489_00800 [Rhodovibrionaceae bacterium]
MLDSPFREAGASPVRPDEHIEDLLGEAQGFGSLLFDSEGRAIVEDGATWLYTTLYEDGRWTSWVRRFHLETRTASPARQVLGPEGEEDRAVLHHVMVAREGLIVGFYSNGRGLRAATAASPEEPFTPVRSFALDPVQGWETRGGVTDGWSLEANGAYLACTKSETELVFWEGYDSYRRSGRLGDLGWAQLSLNLGDGTLSLIERHPANPLPFRPEGWACARCGGNLASSLRIRNLYPFFYYLRPDARRISLALALSVDPLFQEVQELHLIGRPAGQEVLIEKFQSLGQEDKLSLFYESQFADGTWHTGLRTYFIR